MRRGLTSRVPLPWLTHLMHYAAMMNLSLVNAINIILPSPREFHSWSHTAVANLGFRLVSHIALLTTFTGSHILTPGVLACTFRSTITYLNVLGRCKLWRGLKPRLHVPILIRMRVNAFTRMRVSLTRVPVRVKRCV